MFKTNYKFLSVALLFAICPILNLYAQKDNAGLPFNGVVRSAEEGFAAQEFRRGVQAYYRGVLMKLFCSLKKPLTIFRKTILLWIGWEKLIIILDLKVLHCKAGIEFWKMAMEDFFFRIR